MIFWHRLIDAIMFELVCTNFQRVYLFIFFVDHVIVFQQFSCSQYYILQIQHMEHEHDASVEWLL